MFKSVSFHSTKNGDFNNFFPYFQEINDLHARMERSQQVILELEESTRKSGQRDSEVAEMMRKTREASEMELKRYIEEAEAKHHLDVSDIRRYILTVYVANYVYRRRIYVCAAKFFVFVILNLSIAKEEFFS